MLSFTQRSIAIALITCCFSPAIALADWPTPMGGYDHARRSDAPLDGTDLVPVWSLSTLGLPTDAALVEVDGDPDVELLYVTGGHAHAFQVDGTPEWSSTAPFLGSILPPTDLDGDGRPELIFRRKLQGVTVLRGWDGSLLWESDDQDLSNVAQVLVGDLDGDGLADLLAAERDCGFLSHGVGRTVAWSFAESPPTELFRLEEETRDYNCGRTLRLADTDGDDALEVLALGNEHAYLYSTITGDLLEESASFGALPFGVAQLTVIPDEDGDLILLATNNSSEQAEDSRRLTLLGRNESGLLAPRWTRSVEDVLNDRHHTPVDPVVDLDADGHLEVIHAFLEADSGAWTTYVVDIEDGQIVTEVPGRVEAVLRNEGSPPEVIVWTPDEGIMVRYSLVEQTLERRGTLQGNRLVSVGIGYDLSGAGRSLPLSDPDGELLYIISSVDSSGGALENATLRVFDQTNEEYLPTELEVPTMERLVVGSSTVGEGTFAHFAETGAATLLNGHLEAINHGDDGLTNLWVPQQSESPVIGGHGASGGVVLSRDDRLYVLDDASLANPATGTGSTHSIIGWVDRDADGTDEWIGMDMRYLEDLPDLACGEVGAADNAWETSGLVERSDEQTIRWGPVLLSQDIDADGVADVVVQTRSLNADTHTIQVFSGATGDAVWGSPYTVPRTYYDRAISFVGGDGPLVASTLGFHLRIHDPTDGVVLWESSIGGPRGLVAVDLDDQPGQEIVTSSPDRALWWAFDEEAETLWSQTSLNEELPNAPHRGQGAVPIRAGERTLLVEGRAAMGPFSHNLVVVDAGTGEILHEVYLFGGSVTLAGEQPARTSLGAGVGFDATAEDAPLFAVGGDDGFLYLIDPAQSSADPEYPANLLVKSVQLGSPIAALSAIDVDDDGMNELLVPGQDGVVRVMDRPQLASSLTVRDTDCDDPAVDVDTISWANRFCAAWSVDGAAVDGVLVTLREQLSWIPIAGPATVTEGSSVTFSSLNLQIGSTYIVEAQAFRGGGSEAIASNIFVSDGATVAEDETPPEINGFVATPDALVPGLHETVFSATLSDNSRLARFELKVRSDADEIVFSVDGSLSTDQYTLEEVWLGLDSGDAPVPPGAYSAQLVAYDFEGLSAEATVTVSLLEEQQSLDEDVDVDLDAGADAGVDAPVGLPDGWNEIGVADLTQDAATTGNTGLLTGPPPESGCGCRAANNAHSGRFAVAVVFSAVLWVRRRRRQPSTGVRVCG